MKDTQRRVEFSSFRNYRVEVIRWCLQVQKLFGIDLEPDFSMAKEERSGQFKYVLWGGFLLTLVYSFFHASDVRLFQAYIATAVCYGMTFYINRGNYLAKLWLWKSIIASLPIHALYLAAIFWADKASPQGMTKPVIFIPALTVGCAVENSLFGAIADRFQPPNIKTDSQPSPD